MPIVEITSDANILDGPPSRIASFDFDGVLFNGVGMPALRPGPNDVIITGRSWEESNFVQKYLFDRGIDNTVFYNNLRMKEKTRETSGFHKAKILNTISEVVIHYDDDPVQAEVIRRYWKGIVILLDNPLVTL